MRFQRARRLAVRDSDVREMVLEILEGTDRDDPCRLVNGLRSLFGILEMMKLVSRPILI